MKRLLHNYWFRWFAWTFLIGAALIPIILLATFIRLLIEARNFAGTVVSNPFIDFTTPSGETVATGDAAWVLAILLSGVSCGLTGLAIAALKRAFWR